jgi:PPOX class probable F420-dependent enzyme
MATIARDRAVGRSELYDFIRTRPRGVLLTRRAGGWPQASLVTLGLGDNGDLLVSTYPERAKTRNLRRDPLASVVVMSEEFNGEWVQCDGIATVLDVPEAVDGLVEYYRNIRGHHDDWDEYRSTMVAHGKSLIRITIERWGPISRGGFPARLFGDDAV